MTGGMQLLHMRGHAWFMPAPTKGSLQNVTPRTVHPAESGKPLHKVGAVVGCASVVGTTVVVGTAVVGGKVAVGPAVIRSSGQVPHSAGQRLATSKGAPSPSMQKPASAAKQPAGSGVPEQDGVVVVVVTVAVADVTDVMVLVEVHEPHKRGQS